MNSWLPRKSKTYFDDPPAVPPVSPPPPPPPLPPPAGKLFTQADVDKIVQDYRVNMQKTIKEQTERLEVLQNTANLTAAEKEELKQTLENLSNQHKTEAQRQADAAEKAKKKYESDLALEQSEKKKYQTGYHNLIITNAITVGAAVSKAADPSGNQLKMMLLPQAKVVEQVGEDGKPTGNLVAVVPLNYTDPKTKKAVSVELPVAEAIAKMSELDEYANLFLIDGRPGVGGNSGAGAGGKSGHIDWSKLTPKEHREARREALK